MLEQLSFEDVFQPEDLIPWKQGNMLWRCNVLAVIPPDIKVPTEKGWNHGQDLWSNYTWIVWHYEGSQRKCDWSEAIRVMQHHRDSGEPAWMQLWREPKGKCLFIPTGILKYS